MAGPCTDLQPSLPIINILLWIREFSPTTIVRYFRGHLDEKPELGCNSLEERWYLNDCKRPHKAPTP